MGISSIEIIELVYDEEIAADDDDEGDLLIYNQDDSWRLCELKQNEWR